MEWESAVRLSYPMSLFDLDHVFTFRFVRRWDIVGRWEHVAGMKNGSTSLGSASQRRAPIFRTLFAPDQNGVGISGPFRFPGDPFRASTANAHSVLIVGGIVSKKVGTSLGCWTRKYFRQQYTLSPNKDYT